MSRSLTVEFERGGTWSVGGGVGPVGRWRGRGGEREEERGKEGEIEEQEKSVFVTHKKPIYPLR